MLILITYNAEQRMMRNSDPGLDSGSNLRAIELAFAFGKNRESRGTADPTDSVC